MRPAALLLVLALGAAPIGAQSPPDTLWQKAVEIAGANLRWVPGLIVTRTDEVDDQGRVKNSHESWLRMQPGEGGEPVSRIEKLFRNGKDETAKAKRDEAEQKAREQEAKRRAKPDPKPDAPSRFGGSTPFDPGVQDSVTFRRLPAAASDSAGTVVYEFRQQLPDGVKVTGTTRLIDGSGVPIDMRLTTDPLPKRVKELTIVVRFGRGDQDAWWPKEMTVQAMGKMLVFKKRFRSFMSFREYWWREAPHS